VIKDSKFTSRDTFGQYDASRKLRLAQFWAISLNVSSLTHEQLDMSKETNCGHDVTADRIAESGSLWQDPISSSCKRGQWSTV